MRLFFDYPRELGPLGRLVALPDVGNMGSLEVLA